MHFLSLSRHTPTPRRAVNIIISVIEARSPSRLAGMRLALEKVRLEGPLDRT